MSRATWKTARKRRAHPPQGGSNHRKAKSTSVSGIHGDEKDAEIARLTRDLVETQAKLREIEDKGADAYTARKIEALLEAAQIARGQAFDASLARNRAEGELRTVQRAILEARGASGWLVRRAARRILAQAAARPGN